MQCPYCKQENADSAAFCVFCRHPIAAESANLEEGIWLFPPASAQGNEDSAAAFVRAESATQKAEPKTTDSWLPRILFFLGIFIIGVGLGLSVSNWFTRSGRAPSAISDAAAETSAAAISSYPKSAQSVKPAKNRRHTLPDDSTPRSDRLDEPVTAPEPTTKRSLTKPKAAGSSARAQPDSDKASSAPKRPRREAADKNTQRSSKAASSHAAKARPQAPRLAQVEASRKSHSSNSEDEPDRAVASADLKTPRTRALLNQCADRVSWIEREKCKWQVCGNQWGQHGCPSYSSQPSQH